MKKTGLVLLMILLAGCLPAGQAADEANAKNAMEAFFNALANGQYSEAVSLYGGEYEILSGWNPDLSPTNLESLWERGCEQNGLVCMEVLDIVRAEESETGFEFTVTFKAKDGELFQFTGCCGETLPEPITEYAIRVEKVGSDYKVLSLPPYVP